MDVMFVGEAAALLSDKLGRTVTPRELTALFYGRVVPDEYGPMVGGRRVIDPDRIDAIVAVIRERDAQVRAGEVHDDAHG